jgi:hypothetical protein
MFKRDRVTQTPSRWQLWDQGVALYRPAAGSLEGIYWGWIVWLYSYRALLAATLILGGQGYYLSGFSLGPAFGWSE